MSLMGAISELIAKGNLFIETEENACEKTTYEERPEFQPHVGQNYFGNSERTLVISEIFSTKNPPKLKKDESYCEYVLKNTNDPSCVNIQQALQRHDENLTAENIAFCFFIHKEKVKVGSYRSDFSPRDLDNAINTLVPLINLLKPQKIVFLGSQTKRTVERRSGSKVLKRKSLEQFLAESSIETEVISLRGRAHNEATIELNKPKRFHFTFDRSKPKKRTAEEQKEIDEVIAFLSDGRLEKMLKALEDCRQMYVRRMIESRIFVEKKLEKDEYIEDFKWVARLYTSFLDFFLRAKHEKKETPDGVTKILRYEDLLQILRDRDELDHFEIEECNEMCLEALQHYYNDLQNGNTTYENDIRNAFSYVSKKLNVAIIGLNCYQEVVEILDDECVIVTELVCRFLNDKMMALQRLLIPIKAVMESFDNDVDNSGSYMSQKIEFVKDLVKELRPKNDNDPGQVMSLQMVAKRLNENNPPITTTLGKKYDSKGKGVIVLLRKVYKILIESSSEEEQNIAAEMLHCFTKRPVVKVFVRNEDNVTEEEYWKPFKNMDAKES